MIKRFIEVRISPKDKSLSFPKKLYSTLDFDLKFPFFNHCPSPLKVHGSPSNVGIPLEFELLLPPPLSGIFFIDISQQGGHKFFSVKLIISPKTTLLESRTRFCYISKSFIISLMILQMGI